MAELVVDETEVQLRLGAVEHALGVHGNLSVARSALERAEVVSDPLARVHGFRVGERLPGVNAMGSFTSSEEKIFAVVHARQHQGIVLHFDGGEYDTWIIGCEDPASMITMLRAHGVPIDS